MTIYTAGYTGLKLKDFAALLERHAALQLVDIRFSARSRVPEWTGEVLRETFGARYTHLKALGNVNYKNDQSIAIANFEAGAQALERLLAANKAPLLLCACKYYESCHRAVVATLLRKQPDIKVVSELSPCMIREGTLIYQMPLL